MPLDYTTAEIYLRAADGTGMPTQLTSNTEEERAPDWSHHGDRIAYMCHGGSPRFEICVTDLNGNPTQVTHNDLPHLGPAWSPDDTRIVFNRPTPGRGNQLWWVTADGSTEQLLVPSEAPTGSTLGANVGVLRVKTDN
jgi:Tol biopolymer transport system component